MLFGLFINQQHKINNSLATFKINTGTAKGKTWKAEGANPITKEKVTLQDRQKRVAVGKQNPMSEKTFDESIMLLALLLINI